jgi:hypothetical protein
VDHSHSHGGGLALKTLMLLKRRQSANYVRKRLPSKTARQRTCFTICKLTTAQNMKNMKSFGSQRSTTTGLQGTDKKTQRHSARECLTTKRATDGKE